MVPICWDDQGAQPLRLWVVSGYLWSLLFSRVNRWMEFQSPPVTRVTGSGLAVNWVCRLCGWHRSVYLIRSYQWRFQGWSLLVNPQNRPDSSFTDVIFVAKMAREGEQTPQLFLMGHLSTRGPEGRRGRGPGVEGRHPAAETACGHHLCSQRV